MALPIAATNMDDIDSNENVTWRWHGGQCVYLVIVRLRPRIDRHYQLKLSWNNCPTFEQN